MAQHRALAALEPTLWQECVGLKSIPAPLPVPPCSCSSPPGLNFRSLENIYLIGYPCGKTVSKDKHIGKWNEKFSKPSSVRVYKWGCFRKLINFTLSCCYPQGINIAALKPYSYRNSWYVPIETIMVYIHLNREYIKLCLASL